MSTSKEAKEAKEEEQAAHYALIEQLDIHSIHKSFRNPSWRPNQRRNKNIKAILGDGPNLAQASRSLSKLVLEKSLKPNGAGMTAGGLSGGGAGAPSATYTNIESAPSLAPQKRYCDVTGLPAPYQDPKTRLRYHNKEVFSLIRGLPQGYAEQRTESCGTDKDIEAKRQ
ncbi:hypothetical protein VMCG_02469 [Cytospora schulzeri]|uniref:Vps72/YL1 C-terminal domain-containing protein n=1 Tax=Cytospora schulzeri TaxID=448051 RepID=A0A423X0R0_9PEZI|nr:hypothetical protein VMCG_02469 [Valsa malicola]